MGQIQDLIEQAHGTAREKKFWDTLEYLKLYGHNSLSPDVVNSIIYQMYGNRLMHITRELSEAWEEMRVNGLTDAFKDELADSAIVLFDFCGEIGVDLEERITMKMDKNKSRPDKHGKRF